MSAVPASATPSDPAALRLDEPLADALRRLGLRQYDMMLAALDQPEGYVAVHEVRKATKRLRSLIRLAPRTPVYEGLGEHTEPLRLLARSIAPARDADVLIETLDRVRAATAADLDAEAFGGDLLSRRDRVHHDVFGDGSGLRPAVTAGRARLAAWDAAAAGRGGGFAAIESGLRRTYRRGRQRLNWARRNPTETAFHDWRKSVKQLGYQIEALAAGDRSDLLTLLLSLEELGRLLGEGHDLAVLAAVARTRDDATAQLIDAIRAAEHGLQLSAEECGTALYRAAPDEFVAGLGVPASRGED